MKTPRSRPLPTICWVVIGVLAMAGVATASTEPLNPPPPPFLTCNATGSGTTCRATLTTTFSFPREFSCGSGSNRFYLNEAGTTNRQIEYTYNTSGNLSRRVTRVTSLTGTFTNAKTGKALPESGHFTITHYFLTPGDLSTDQTTFDGLFAVVLDPANGIVLQDAGHIVFAPDGDVLKEGGKHDYQNSDLLRLCAALA